MNILKLTIAGSRRSGARRARDGRGDHPHHLGDPDRAGAVSHRARRRWARPCSPPPTAPTRTGATPSASASPSARRRPTRPPPRRKTNASKECKAEGRRSGRLRRQVRHGQEGRQRPRQVRLGKAKAKTRRDRRRAGRGRRQRRQDLQGRAQGRPGRLQGQVRHQREQVQRLRQVRLRAGQGAAGRGPRRLLAPRLAGREHGYAPGHADVHARGPPPRLHRVRRGLAHRGPRPRAAALAADARARSPRRWPSAATASITIDVLGHGSSDRPRDMWRYSMTFFGEQVVGLLDHLGVDQAVIAGTSLGANIALEVCALGARAGARHGHRDARARQRAARLRAGLHAADDRADARRARDARRLVADPAGPRRGGPELVQIFLDTLRQDPAPSAAVLQGLFFGRVAPHRSIRADVHAAGAGHRPPARPGPPVQRLRACSSTSCPTAACSRPSSILELRTAPERLTNEIARFIDGCWKPQGSGRKAAA